MSLVVLRSSNQNAFLPQKRKNDPVETKRTQLEKLTTRRLPVGDLNEAVRLPVGEDINEWFASHIFDFYDQITALNATLGEFCTTTTCPVMTAGPKYEYRWADGDTIKEPIAVPAPKYIEYLQDWIEAQTANATIFPLEFDEPFPPKFEGVVKKIFKRLFRVYAHIYHSHFAKVVKLRLEAYLNTCFEHFVLFVNEFQLIDEAGLDPLKDLVENILKPNHPNKS